MEITKQDYPIREGLSRLLKVLKAQKLADVSGVNYVTLSLNANGKLRMEQTNLDKVNAALHTIGERLMAMRIERESWLDDYEKLSEYVKVNTLIKLYTDFVPTWSNHHFRTKTDFYYGKFTDEELRRLNEVILQLAMQVMQTRLIRQ